jgi:hypothetical protein
VTDLPGSKTIPLAKEFAPRSVFARIFSIVSLMVLLGQLRFADGE